MNWHTNVSIGELHWRIATFMESYGADILPISHLNKVTRLFFKLSQFRVCSDQLITWAYFNAEQETLFLRGKFPHDIQYGQGKKLWVIHAKISNKLSAFRQLRHLSKDNVCRMVINKNNTQELRTIKLI